MVSNFYHNASHNYFAFGAGDFFLGAVVVLVACFLGARLAIVAGGFLVHACCGAASATSTLASTDAVVSLIFLIAASAEVNGTS
jgi:hypothetical protein